MSVEVKLQGILDDVFGTEVYPVQHPDPDGKESDVAELYAITATVGGSSTSGLEGDAELRKFRMSVSIYGIDFANVLAKSQATLAAMDTANIVGSQAVDNGNDPLTVEGSLPNNIIGVPIDNYENQTKRFVKILEFYIWALA